MNAPSTTPFATTTTIDGVTARAGSVLGLSHEVEITQERINTFAQATNDEQWIHTDPVRAAAGPFGTTIAHGYLSLSLVAGLASETFTISDANAIVNYGLERVRFPAPVPCGAKLSLQVTLLEVTQLPGGVQLSLEATLLLAGSAKPAVVATQILRVYR